MNFLETLVDYDKQLLLFLHSLGCTQFDNFWITITNPYLWIPLILLLFSLGYTTFGLKKSLFISLSLVFAGLLAFVCVNLIKNSVKRIRPLNDASINDVMRILIDASDYSFVSGHSTISFVIAFISYWTLRKQYKLIYLIFLFPLFFAYSRIYLGAHFPLDILAGMLLAYVIALGITKLMQITILKN